MSRFTDRVPPGQLDEPVSLTGAFPATALPGLFHLLVDPEQRPPGPVIAVLVIGHLVLAAAVRPGQPGPGEHVPVRDLLAGKTSAPAAPAKSRTRQNLRRGDCVEEQ
jgi:hypothetical protein